jgi:uncharacterized protein with HEPN domain
MKDNLTYIEHIKEAISKILKYTQDLSHDEFEENEMIQDAVIRNFEIIGEATKKVSSDFTANFQDIPDLAKFLSAIDTNS